MSRFFQLGDDSFHYLLSWLDLVCICRLDTAIGDEVERSLWLHSLHMMDSKAIDEYEHSNLSIKWLITRGARATRIRVRETDRECDRINDETFAGVGALLFQGNANDRNSILNAGCANTSMTRITESYRSDTRDITTRTNSYESIRPRGSHNLNLASINLSGCQSISSKGLSVIAEGCHNLTSINLRNCQSISNEGLSAIAEGCHNLTSINLCNCQSISNEGLSAIAVGCHNLTLINLCYCHNISNEGLSAIVEGCHNLTSINLSGCQSISNEGLSAIAVGCHNLTSIDLCDCQSISNEGLSAIAEGCHNLTSIDVRGYNISNEVISTFRTRYPRLTVKHDNDDYYDNYRDVDYDYDDDFM